MGPKLSRPLGEDRRNERSIPDTVNQNLSPGLHEPLLIPSNDDGDEGGVDVEERKRERMDVDQAGEGFYEVYSPLVKVDDVLEAKSR